MSATLANYLRALPDEALAGLLRARPDLAVPLPADLTALAARAQSRLSVARALEDLDLFSLEVIDAIRLLGSTPEGAMPEGSTISLPALLAMTTPYRTETRAAVDLLRGLALVYGPDQALRAIDMLNEVGSAYPAGLGRPAASLAEGPTADLMGDPAALRRTIMSAPPEARTVLDRLAAGPPVGTLTEARENRTDDSPVRWLLNRGLLIPISDDAVELPREVGVLLRRDDGPLGQLHPRPPDITPRPHGPALDSAGAGQVIELVRLVEATMNALPVPALKAGGVSSRDLRRLAATVGVDESTAGLLLEVSHAADLIGVTDTIGGDPTDGISWLPTTGFDVWVAAPFAERWRTLADAWLCTPREAVLIGTRDDRNRPVNALSGELAAPDAPILRSAVLAILAELPEQSGADVEETLAVLHWRSPRRSSRATDPRAVLREAATLGLSAMGGLPSYTRALLTPGTDDDPLGVAERPPTAVEILDALLPAPVETVILQADLTLVVPGPPSTGLAAELVSVSSRESPSVYRVSADSLRQALDAGYTVEDLHGLFTRRSTTPVPQALTYLINDVARRHGGLRAGSCAGYLCSDDATLLSEIIADRRLIGLGLRRLAPTVLVSPHPIHHVLSAARDAGYAVILEDSAGAVVLSRPAARRAAIPAGRRPSAPTIGTRLPAPDELHAPYLAGLVEELRHGDARMRAAKRIPDAVSGNLDEALAVLGEAIRDKFRVWVGYVDPHGATVSRLVRPLSIGAGYLRAEDERRETLHTFALARITSATRE